LKKGVGRGIEDNLSKYSRVFEEDVTDGSYG